MSDPLCEPYLLKALAVETNPEILGAYLRRLQHNDSASLTKEIYSSIVRREHVCSSLFNVAGSRLLCARILDKAISQIEAVKM